MTRSRTHRQRASTQKQCVRTLRPTAVNKCCSKTSHLLLGDIDDTDPDVRAPLSDHRHRRTSDIPGAHTADVVLEILGSHGASCAACAAGKMGEGRFLLF